MKTRPLSRWLAVGAVVLAGLTLSPDVPAQAPDDPATAPAGQAQERQLLATELDAGPPASLSGAELDEWWARLFRRANAVDSNLAYRVSEARYKARSGNPYAVQRWAVSQLSRGQVDEFRRLAETAWRQHRQAAVRAGFAAESAFWSLAMLGDIETAGRWLRRAEDDLARADPRHPELLYAQAMHLGAKARWLAARGQFADARQTAAEAVARARVYAHGSAAKDEESEEIGRRTLDRTLGDLIATQIDTGQHFDAQQTLEEAERLAARERSLVIVRRDLIDLTVRLRMEQGRYADAVALATATAGQLKPAPGMAPSARYVRMLLRVQEGLAATGQWAAAWDALQQGDLATAATPQLRDRTANPLVRGWVLLKLGRAEPALPGLDAERRRAQALLGTRHLGTALAGGLQAWALWESGRRDEALARFDDALPVLLAPPGAAEDFMNRGLRQMIRRAIFEAYLRAAASVPDVAGTKPRALDALRVADHLMGSSVQEALNDAAPRSSVDPRLQDLLRREQDLRQRVNALLAAFNRPADDSGDAATPELSRATAERLREANADYLAARDALQAVLPREARADASDAATPASIAAQLAPGEVFVMLWPAADATYVWAVPARGGTPRFHAAALGEREVAALVARVRGGLDWGDNGRPPRFDLEAAARLHDTLLVPLGPVLSDARHWVVASGGALGQIPLALLPQRLPAGSEPVPWLLHRHAFSQWPSARAWVALAPLRQARRAEQALLAWADPVFTPGAVAVAPTALRALDLRRADLGVRYRDIPPLPDTRDEVQAIARTLRADPQRDLILGASATRGSVLEASRTGELARRRVVVFATHGLLAGDLPNLTQPALAMASTPEVETQPLSPLLTLDDVLGLKLNADWVVLSACNTAGADGRAEEALSGLARGFFYAGARSLLVTHWAVETESAKRLTTGTFEHFAQQPQAGRAESLRQAMLKVMADTRYAHPIFWAPYALVGDGGR